MGYTVHMNFSILYALVAILDLWAAISVVRSDLSAWSVARRTWRAAVLGLVLILHGVLWYQHVFALDGMRFGFAPAISITLLLACVVLWLEGVSGHWSILDAVVYPAAAVGLILPIFFPGTLAGSYVDNLYFQLHLSVALAASSVVSLAAVHAILMSIQEHRLHTPLRMPLNQSKFLFIAFVQNRLGLLLDQLPSLLAMERLLFRFIVVGFLLLTLTLASGVLFTEQWLQQVLVINHKVVFTIFSWAIFGALLFGRRYYGWRGKVALRWTLAGVCTLLLAYVGSRFVLEVILQRAV